MHDPTVADFLPGLAARSTVTSGGVAWMQAGQGPLLILCHGGAGSWNHWADNIPALARHFTVVGLDAPGLGASPDIDRGIDMHSYLEIVRAAADEITDGAPQVHVAGFSFGGLIAAALAAHLRQRAAGLTLVGAAGFRKPARRQLTLKSLRALQEELGRSLTDDDIRAQHAANLSQLMIHDPDRIDARAIALQAANVDRTRFDSRPFSWSDQTPVFLRDMTCPLQVTYGRHDTSVGGDLGYRIEQCRIACPDAQVTVLPACGHWAMYEAADAVNALLIGFHRTASSNDGGRLTKT